MKLDSAVLGPLTGVSGKKLVTRARGQIGRLSALVIGRSITSFALQLGGGLYWTVLKGAAVALSHAARPSVPHSRKDDPVRQLYDAMKREDPDVVSRRTFDCWAEGALLGCADDGLITLPKRVGNQKQPKPSDIAALRKITWRQLRAIAKKFRSMEKLRTALRPPTEPEKSKMFRTLVRAIAVLEAEQDVPSECMPLLEKLSELATAAISADAMSPNCSQERNSRRHELPNPHQTKVQPFRRTE